MTIETFSEDNNNKLEFSIYKLSFSEYIYRLPPFIVLLLDGSSFQYVSIITIIIVMMMMMIFDDQPSIFILVLFHVICAYLMEIFSSDFFCISRKRQRKKIGPLLLYMKIDCPVFFFCCLIRIFSTVVVQLSSIVLSSSLSPCCHFNVVLDISPIFHQQQKVR